MIEFADFNDRVFVIQVTTISRFTRSGNGTQIVLADGTELHANVAYANFREAVMTVRNQFVSLLSVAA